jgi:hypothetical protein
LVPAGAAATVTAVALGMVTLLGGGDDTDPAAPPDVPRITDPDGIRLPLDEYEHQPEGYVDYMRARTRLVAECGAAFRDPLGAGGTHRQAAARG